MNSKNKRPRDTDKVSKGAIQIARKEDVPSPGYREDAENRPQRIRVILAEDHEILRTAVLALLKTQSDIEVIAEAVDGTVAAQLACELVPDVIVMDIGLPGVNGIESTRMIKSRVPSVKVLALSAHTNTQLIESMTEAGASGFVPKSAIVAGLAAAIRTVASGGVCPCFNLPGGPA